MLKFLTFRRFNYIDTLGIGLFIGFLDKSEHFYAFASIFSTTVLGIMLERKAFGPRPTVMDDHNKR